MAMAEELDAKMVSEAAEEVTDSYLDSKVAEKVQQLYSQVAGLMSMAPTKRHAQAEFMKWATEEIAKIYVVLEGLCLNLERVEESLKPERGTQDPASGVQ